MFCLKILIAYLLILLTAKVTGVKRENQKDFSLISMLTPCPWDYAVFFQEICVQCTIMKKTGNFSNINFKREMIYQSNNIKLLSRSTSMFVFNSRNESTKNSISKGVGCLQGIYQTEAWRIKEGIIHLNKRTLAVVTIERHPFVKISKDGTFTGVCFDLMKALQEKYNFSMKVFLPYDGNWGSELPNGTWNGMVGQVLRKEADIGVAGFSVTLQRSKVIQFSSSYYQEETSILIPPPAQSATKLTILIKPLSNIVWASLLLTILVLAPTLYMMHVVSLRISGEKSTKGFVELTGELLHFMIGSLVQESVISPVNKTTRFLIILWWFLTLTIANVYVAQLVSYLSAPKLMNKIESLNDLVNQRNIMWTFRKGTAHQSLFQSETSSGVYKLVGDGVPQENLALKDADGINKVLTGTFAFIKEKSFLDVAIGQDFRLTGGKCRMTVAKEKFFKVETALILPKGSKILQILNLEISRSLTTGLMEKWKALHWENLLWCEDAINYIPTTLPPTRKLTKGDLLGAWFLLGSGALISILGFIRELLNKKNERKEVGKFLK